MRPDDLCRDTGRLNESLKAPYSESVGRLRFYGRFNRLLDEQVVPYTVNESAVVAYREVLCRKGDPASLCYWLLVARLAELTLLCAGHYADCGEITAAGDLLVNPRRTNIYVQGVVQPILKDRHQRLSEQLDPGGISPTERMDWLKRNTTVRMAEPPLLPGFLSQLVESGVFEGEFLNAFQDRMKVVADTMRFSGIASQIMLDGDRIDQRHRSSGKAGSRPARQCRFNRAWFIKLGHEVETQLRLSAWRYRVPDQKREDFRRNTRSSCLS